MNRRESNREIYLGVGALIGIVVFLGLIIAVQYIFLQHPVRWDITGTGKHTLASQSKNVLKSFEKKHTPIEAVAFYATSDLRRKAPAQDLLDQYRDVYPKFTYKFVDPDRQYSLAKQYDIDTYPTTVIKGGDRKERIHEMTEESITNALVKLLRGETKKVYFLKGHGEISPESTKDMGMSFAKEKIIKQNYEVSETVLLQASSVPDDATMLVIAGADADPMDQELELIRSYLKKGGKLLVMMKPFRAPKLREFLKEYGFETTDDLVIDPTSKVFGGSHFIPVITRYTNFPITKNFNVASFFPEAQSIRVSKSSNSAIDAKELALTGPLCWTINEEQLKSGQLKFDPEKGKKGEIPLMAVSTYTYTSEKDTKDTQESKKKEETPEASAALDSGKNKVAKDKDTTPTKARIVVFGSSKFAANKLFRIQGNGDLFMNTVSWLAEEEDLISIRPKATKAEPIVLSVRQLVMIFLTTVVFIPLAWFVAGGFVFFYRRWKAAV
jgi:ABC-type uncharacterized transport system involved in gliding motility auxiliary subunit